MWFSMQARYNDTEDWSHKHSTKTNNPRGWAWLKGVVLLLENALHFSLEWNKFLQKGKHHSLVLPL